MPPIGRRRSTIRRAWLDERLNGSVRIGLPWPSLLAFVRLATNSMVVRHPVTPADAWRQVDEWLSCEPATVPLAGGPIERYSAVS